MTDESTTEAAGVEIGHDQEHVHREPEPATAALDLERIERDLAGVEAALRRLDDGSYWTDEVTGEPIADEVLAIDPVARRAR